LPFLKAEYFNDLTEKTVFNEVQEFINKYKNLPTHEALVINFTETKNLSEEQVRESIQLLKELHEGRKEDTEKQWLIEQTEKFCQDRAIYNAIMESVSILDDKQGRKSKI